jgi:alpha-1,3-rhamnosyltransferase
LKNNKNEKISVVVTTYNQSKFIVEALDSVKNQNYANIELIVCDDKSKDDTIKKVEVWATQNQSSFQNNIIIIQNRVNMGISANHNEGLKRATGEYITFLHGDDKLHGSNAIEKILEFLKKNNLLFCSTRLDTFYDDGEKYIFSENLIKEDDKKKFLLDAKKQFRLLAYKDFIPGIIVCRTDFLRELGGYDNEFKMCEDWVLWLIITNKGHEIKIYPESFIDYRRHSEAISIATVTNGSPVFLEHKIKTIDKYILPNSGKLDFLTRWAVSINKKYLKKYIQYGSTIEAHKKARWIRLFDPFIYKELFSRIF